MDIFIGIIVGLILVAIYYAPTITAYQRKTKNIIPVFIINAFLGWTFIGWVIAFAMAYTSEIKNK